MITVFDTEYIEYLKSQRTLTESEVKERTALHDAEDLRPEERVTILDAPRDWWAYPGHWTSDGDYDPDAPPVTLPHTLDLPGEVHHA